MTRLEERRGEERRGEERRGEERRGEERRGEERRGEATTYTVSFSGKLLYRRGLPALLPLDCFRGTPLLSLCRPSCFCCFCCCCCSCCCCCPCSEPGLVDPFAIGLRFVSICRSEATANEALRVRWRSGLDGASGSCGGEMHTLPISAAVGKRPGGVWG